MGSYVDLTGTYNGTPTGTPYFNRDGLEFDGVNDSVTTGDLDLDTNMTVVALVRPDALAHAGGGTYPRVVDKLSCYSFYVESSGKIAFVTNGVSDTATLSVSLLEIGEPVVVGGTFDSAAGVRKIFVNGLLDAEETGLTGTINTNANTVRIGDNQNNNRKWQGGITSIALFNSTLTELEVAEVTSELLNQNY
jgi:hypothetical protein